MASDICPSDSDLAMQVSETTATNGSARPRRAIDAPTSPEQTLLCLPQQPQAANASTPSNPTLLSLPQELLDMIFTLAYPRATYEYAYALNRIPAGFLPNWEHQGFLWGLHSRRTIGTHTLNTNKTFFQNATRAWISNQIWDEECIKCLNCMLQIPLFRQHARTFAFTPGFSASCNKPECIASNGRRPWLRTLSSLPHLVTLVVKLDSWDLELWWDQNRHPWEEIFDREELERLAGRIGIDVEIDRGLAEIVLQLSQRAVSFPRHQDRAERSERMKTNLANLQQLLDEKLQKARKARPSAEPLVKRFDESLNGSHQDRHICKPLYNGSKVCASCSKGGLSAYSAKHPKREAVQEGGWQDRKKTRAFWTSLAESGWEN